MRSGLRAPGRMIPAICALLTVLLGLAVPPTRANDVLQWNETTLKAIEANGQNNVVATRTLAMVHAAVHDALNAITRRYAAYYFEGPADPAASPEAAAAAAAHTVLIGVVSGFGTPAQKGAAMAVVDQAVHGRAGRASPTAPPATRAWRWAGRPARRCSRSARTTARRRTRRTRRASGPAAGARTPTPSRRTRRSRTRTLARGYAPSAVPGWGNVTPFTLLSASQFWLPRSTGTDEPDLRP